MTEAERLNLQPGQKVIVRMDDGTKVEKTVRTIPWQLGHGEWVVGLKGISGGYLLSRVVRFASDKNNKAYLEKVIYAFLDVTDGMKPHDYFPHMGGTLERAEEVVAIRAEAFEMFGEAWINSKED